MDKIIFDGDMGSFFKQLRKYKVKYLGTAEWDDDDEIDKLTTKILKAGNQYDYYDVGEGSENYTIVASPKGKQIQIIDDEDNSQFEKMSANEILHEMGDDINTVEDYQSQPMYDKYADMCPPGFEYVKGYIKRDGTHVKGFCRKMK